jgi:transposase
MYDSALIAQIIEKRDEVSATTYFIEHLKREGKLFCHRCRLKELWVLNNGRLRCPKCKYTFYWSSKRYIGRFKLKAVQWLSIIKNFSEGATALSTSKNISLSYKTTLKAFNFIRYIIFLQCKEISEQSLRGEMKFHARGPWAFFDLPNIYKMYFFAKPKNKIKWDPKKYPYIPVVGINNTRGYVKMMYSYSPFNVLQFKQIKIVKRGNLVYTDKSKTQDAYMFYGYHLLAKRIPFMITEQFWDAEKIRQKFSRGKVYIDKQKHGFWIFAKERLKRFRGVSTLTFPLYMKELEFRYKGGSIMEISHSLLSFLCDLEVIAHTNKFYSSKTK